MKPRTRPMFAALLAALVSGACAGSIGGGDGNGGPGGGPGSGPGGANGNGDGDGGASADPSAAGPMPLRRLSALEYASTLRDLFHDPSLTLDLPPDPVGESGFAEAPLMSDDTADSLRGAANQIAAAAVQSLPGLLGCDPAAKGEATCAAQFVATFGRRAYRSALEADDQSGLMALYQSARTTLGYGFSDAIRLVVAAMLQSPRFLYHWERDGGPAQVEGSAVKLSAYGLASRLSYFLWSTMPDDALLDAADQGRLGTDDGLSAEIDRMLASDHFVATAETFHSQWLGLAADAQKDPTLFPSYDPALRDAMRAETTRFLRYVFLEGDGRLSTLFTSTVADVDALTAPLYGVPAPAPGTTVRVQLDPAQRAGLLTRAALLTVDTDAAQTNPPRSGKVLWTKVLCKTIDPPPPGAASSFHFDKALTTRENFAKLQTEPSCSGCHATLNPLGFAFEAYDPIGRFRTSEGGKPVDASGTYTTTAGSKPFTSIVDLSRTLATDPDATACMARTWLRFALQRSDGDADHFSLDSAFHGFASASFDVRVLLKSIALSRTFRYRAIETGEAL